MKPHDYRDLIAAYLDANFSSHGVVIYTEVSLGKTIIGKNRKLDVLALRKADQRALAFETKYQQVPGTTDEKIPYALSPQLSFALKGPRKADAPPASPPKKVADDPE